MLCTWLLITLQKSIVFLFSSNFSPSSQWKHKESREYLLLSIVSIIYCIDTGYSARFTARWTTSCPTSRSPAPSSRCSPSRRTAGARSCGRWRRARAAPPCCSCSPPSGSAAPPSPRPPQHFPPRSTRTSQYQHYVECVHVLYSYISQVLNASTLCP